MAKTRNRQFKLDATRPFYAAVGVTDLAVEYARNAAADMQTRFEKIELEPTALPVRVQELTDEAVAELTETYDELADRGRDLVARIRRQQSTQDAKEAGKNTVSRAKTARTQTRNAAKSSTEATKRSAKRTADSAKRTANTTKAAAKSTGNTAKRNAKATNTSAQKAANAGAQATTEAAKKVGD